MYWRGLSICFYGILLVDMALESMCVSMFMILVRMKM